MCKIHVCFLLSLFCRNLCTFVANLFCRDLRAFVWRKNLPKIASVEKKCQISGMVATLVGSKNVFVRHDFKFYIWNTATILGSLNDHIFAITGGGVKIS